MWYYSISLLQYYVLFNAVTVIQFKCPYIVLKCYKMVNDYPIKLHTLKVQSYPSTGGHKMCIYDFILVPLGIIVSYPAKCCFTCGVRSTIRCGRTMFIQCDFSDFVIEVYFVIQCKRMPNKNPHTWVRSRQNFITGSRSVLFLSFFLIVVCYQICSGCHD
jgi:hypothetical protein